MAIMMCNHPIRWNSGTAARSIPLIKDRRKFLARGSCDDKGQMFMHVKSA
jgi:acetylornithine deacetylase/succinyl-diaminopimelate desuccinylase-like protein